MRGLHEAPLAQQLQAALVGLQRLAARHPWAAGLLLGCVERAQGKVVRRYGWPLRLARPAALL